MRHFSQCRRTLTTAAQPERLKPGAFVGDSRITDQNTDGNITLSGTTAQPASIATDGVYVVKGIMYTGDTRGQPWYMDMMCEARGAADMPSSTALQRGL